MMSDLSKTYHRVSFVVSSLVDDDTAHITADFLRHHVSSLKTKVKKLSIKKSKMAFLSQQFHHYNKKTSCSVSGGAVVLVLLSQLTLELITLLTTQRY